MFLFTLIHDILLYRTLKIKKKEKKRPQLQLRADQNGGGKLEK